MGLSWIAKTSATHCVGKAKWRLPHLDDATLLGMENVLIQQYIGASPFLPGFRPEASLWVLCTEAGRVHTCTFTACSCFSYSIQEEKLGVAAESLHWHRQRQLFGVPVRAST